MDSHTVNILELKKVLSTVKKYASTNTGKEIISGLNPVNDIDYIKKSLEEVTVARDLIENFSRPPFGGIKDLRENLKKADKEMVLSAEAVLDVKNTIRGCNNLRKYFQKIVEECDPNILDNRYSLLTDKGLEISSLRNLEAEINKAINDYGEIKDSASKKLGSLRSQIDKFENRIRDKLESIIKGSQYQSILQDSLITRRENRYVVPVKQEHKNSFKGIVHDQSASGMTIFMEPMVIVNLNNRLREIKNEEEREIHRILQQLTAGIAAESDVIRKNLKIASVLDVIFARAEHSLQIEGVAPDVNKQGIIKIRGGRHPLLQNEPVPIDVDVGDGFKTLVITGPNTGGKTVALKTIGLFVLMVQTGLHIPANRKSNIAVFNKVYADIGDEQSIEQNLSTFSSHINKIKNFLKNADSRSLVLMDELGAGTDPREGAALGISILEKLKEKNAITVATTHYSQLKSYAYSGEGVENASVEFDIDTLQPTYRLIMGVPGGSNAFAIALKLGIPEEIIEQSRELIDDRELKVEDIIDDLNRERKKYKQLRQDAEEKDRKLKELKSQYREKMNKLNKREQEIISEARDEAEEIVAKARKKTRNIISNLKDNDYYSRPEVDRKATEINEELKELKKGITAKNEIEEKEVDETIEVGDQVRIKSVGQKGKVEKIDKDKNEATVQAGVMTVTADLKDLVKAEVPDTHKKEMIKKYRVNKTQKVSPSLDLRGKRYEEAQRELDKYLDDVFLAGYNNIEIVHGKGTGALREAVHDVLEENPHIPSFRLGKQKEGGAGVTIAEVNH